MHTAEKLVKWNLQRVIQADLQNGSLVQAQIVIGEEPGESAESGTGASTDSSASTAACCRTGCGPEARTHGDGLDFMSLAHPLALNFPLGVRLLYAVLSGNAGNSGDERHPAMFGFDFVEAEQKAGVNALLYGTNVALNLLATRHERSAGSDQVLGKLGLEMLALFQLAGVELVLKFDEESGALRYDVGLEMRRAARALRHQR